MITHLGDISEIQVGYQSREGIHPQINGNHFLLQTRDFDNHHQINWSNLIKFTPSGFGAKSEVRKGDVLFLAKGQDNYAIFINFERDNILAGNSFYIIRTNPETVLPDFLAWWINQTPAQEYIRLNRSGSSLPFLSVASLSNLEVPIPDTKIQQKICKLETLRRKESDLLIRYLTKKYALIQAVCLNAISKGEE